jgi:hypothetical protein
MAHENIENDPVQNFLFLMQLLIDTFDLLQILT